MEALSTFSCGAYYEKRNPIVRAFIEAATFGKGDSTDTCEFSIPKHALRLMVLDGLYRARMMSFTSPLGHALAIVEFSVHGSELALDINAHTSARPGRHCVVETSAESLMQCRIPHDLAPPARSSDKATERQAHQPNCRVICP